MCDQQFTRMSKRCNIWSFASSLSTVTQRSIMFCSFQSCHVSTPHPPDDNPVPKQLQASSFWGVKPQIHLKQISRDCSPLNLWIFLCWEEKTKKTSKDKIIWYLKIVSFSTQFSVLVSPVFNNTNHCIVPTKNWYSDYPISKYHLALNTKGQEQSFCLAWQSFTTLNDLKTFCVGGCNQAIAYTSYASNYKNTN